MINPKINSLLKDLHLREETNTDSIIGNWWNHKILKADQQISPLSGSIKEQVVNIYWKRKY